MMMPIRPMNRNEPMPLMSRLGGVAIEAERTEGRRGDEEHTHDRGVRVQPGKIDDSDRSPSAPRTPRTTAGRSRAASRLMPAEITKHHDQRREDETAIFSGLTNIV